MNNFNTSTYTSSDFYFNNTGRIGSDFSDNSQRNLANDRFSNYILENYYENQDVVHFATSQPTMNFRGNGGGYGLNGNIVDNDSELMIRTQQERNDEKLQLFQRPFSTVPYLGKGSSNPILESQLQQGETASDKKTAIGLSEHVYLDHNAYPMTDNTQQRIAESTYSEVESSQWSRCGINTRQSST